MVEEDKRLANDTGEEADGTVDACATELEISETAQLESTEFRV